MRIQGTPAGTPARHTDATGVSGAGEPVPPVRRTDAVHISMAGRARAEAELPVRPDPASPLTSDQIARIRERIESGAYDSLDVMHAVARRIIAAGDLGPGSDAS
jgi:hypothetical protein